jgi:hypothetical protein
MSSALMPLMWSACIFGSCPCGEPIDEVKQAYVYEPAFALDNVRRGKAVPYQPQAGDILLFTDDMAIWNITYKLAFTGPPYHASIVVKMPDGEFRLLESGPNDTFYVRLCVIPNRLQTWKGLIHVRRREVPLTQEESDRLTTFALRQEGKRYSFVKLAGQLTPLRARTPLKIMFMSKCDGECSNYSCVSIVLEACVYAGLLDKETSRPRATYPQDMFWDKSNNWYINKHLKLAPIWSPPRLWTLNPDAPPAPLIDWSKTEPRK